MSDTSTTPPIPALAIIEGPEYFDARAEGCAEGWPFPHHAYRVRLTHEGRSMETPWRQGMGHTTDPEAHAVIGSLLMTAQGLESCTGFADWAEEYGYNPDSISARSDYDECRRQADALSDMLTRRVMVALMENEDATYGGAPEFARAWAAAFRGVTA